MQSAARRLYTHDGTVIMDLDDLVVWVREEYVREARLQMRREAKAKRLARTQQEQGSKSCVILKTTVINLFLQMHLS